MDSTTLSSEKSSALSSFSPFRDVKQVANMSLLRIVEFATLGRTPQGKVYHHLWTAPEITDLLRKHGLAKEEKTEEK